MHTATTQRQDTCNRRNTTSNKRGSWAGSCHMWCGRSPAAAWTCLPSLGWGSARPGQSTWVSGDLAHVRCSPVQPCVGSPWHAACLPPALTLLSKTLWLQPRGASVWPSLASGMVGTCCRRSAWSGSWAAAPGAACCPGRCAACPSWAACTCRTCRLSVCESTACPVASRLHTCMLIHCCLLACLSKGANQNNRGTLAASVAVRESRCAALLTFRRPAWQITCDEFSRQQGARGHRRAKEPATKRRAHGKGAAQ